MALFQPIDPLRPNAPFLACIDWAARRDPLGHKVHLTIAIIALAMIPLSSSIATIGSSILFVYAALRAPTIWPLRRRPRALELRRQPARGMMTSNSTVEGWEAEAAAAAECECEWWWWWWCVQGGMRSGAHRAISASSGAIRSRPARSSAAAA